MQIFQFFTPKSETFFLNPDATIRQALEKFDSHKFTVVPLVEKNGMYHSTVSTGDILRYIKNEANFDMEMAENVKVADIEHFRSYKACTCSVPMETILSLALEQNFIPVVDDQGIFIGIIKRKAILNRILEEHPEIRLEDPFQNNPYIKRR